jgi:hypothetical protein
MRLSSARKDHVHHDHHDPSKRLVYDRRIFMTICVQQALRILSRPINWTRPTLQKLQTKRWGACRLQVVEEQHLHRTPKKSWYWWRTLQFPWLYQFITILSSSNSIQHLFTLESCGDGALLCLQIAIFDTLFPVLDSAMLSPRITYTPVVVPFSELNAWDKLRQHHFASSSLLARAHTHTCTVLYMGDSKAMLSLYKCHAHACPNKMCKKNKMLGQEPILRCWAILVEVDLAVEQIWGKTTRPR